MAVGVWVCRKASVWSALVGGGDRLSSPALAVCWHLLPARSSPEVYKMQGLRSLLYSRKAVSWAELKLERQERSVVAGRWLLQAFFPDLKEVLSTMGCVSCH